MLEMTDFDNAVEKMRVTVQPVEHEVIETRNALGRCLTEPIRAGLDLPPFSKSAMDGFAVDSKDSSSSFRIVETIAAGYVPTCAISTGLCSKIMTGAMMPDRADMVVRVEYTSVDGEMMRIDTRERGSNVIKKGENLSSGDIVLNPGRIRPQEVGILAEQGIEKIRVVIPPLVGILTTGSELKNPGERLEKGQIYNSNGFQLCAHVQAAGGRTKYYGTVEDDPENLRSAISTGLEECSVLLLTGGVSMGDYDYVPSVLRDVGVDIHFHKLAVKPGKPTLFGTRNDRYIFGLPGNPVSTFVIFEVVVRPFFCKLLGIPYKPVLFRGSLAENITRKDAGRVEFRPVRTENGAVIPIKYHGSSHLHAFSSADGLLRIERGINTLEKGTEVDVRQI